MSDSASQPMCDALDAQDINRIQELIQNGESVNGYYERDIYEGTYSTLLAKAVSDGHINVVKILLDNGADTEIPCIDGYTPLVSASSSGYYDIVELLIKHGADIDYETPSGWTALDKAFSESHKVNHQRILQLLRNNINQSQKNEK
jgi:ankyrin repeat protein